MSPLCCPHHSQRMLSFKSKTDKEGWGMPYGGTRTAGDMKRGGYFHNPVVAWFLPARSLDMPA